jgi:hypothetical protein
MPTINLPFSKEEYEQIQQQKGKMSWHTFILSITTSTQTKKDEEIKQLNGLIQNEIAPKFKALIQERDELRSQVEQNRYYKTLSEKRDKEMQRRRDFIIGKNLWDEYLKTNPSQDKPTLDEEEEDVDEAEN